MLLRRWQSLHPPLGRARGANPSFEAIFGRHAVPGAAHKECDAPELIDTGGLLARKRPHGCHWMLTAPQTATAGLRGGRRPCGAQRRAGARSAQKRHDGASKSAPGPRSCVWTPLRRFRTREAKPARANRPRLRRSHRFVPAKTRLGRFERSFGEGDRRREREPRRQRCAGSRRVVFGSTVMRFHLSSAPRFASLRPPAASPVHAAVSRSKEVKKFLATRFVQLAIHVFFSNWYIER